MFSLYIKHSTLIIFVNIFLKHDNLLIILKDKNVKYGKCFEVFKVSWYQEKLWFLYLLVSFLSENLKITIGIFLDTSGKLKQ